MKFTPTPFMVQAAENVFETMAFVTIVKPLVEIYKHQILKDLGWPLENLFNTYQLPEDVFNVYLARCHEAALEIGFNVEYGYCPLLVAQHLQVEAETTLIDLMEPVTNISAHSLLCLGLDARKEFLDLTLRLLAPFCRNNLSKSGGGSDGSCD